MTANKTKSIKRTKKAILIVGEGLTDKAFLQHIRELYVSRESDFVVKIEGGFGGAPRSVVERAVRLRQSRAYDRCYVLFDADRPLETDSRLERRMRKKPRIEILQTTPCIEGLFLAILRYPNFSPASTSSAYCKREFENNYIAADKKTDKRSFANKFPREALDKHRSSVPELDAILRAMQV